jgi:putative adhesin
MVTLMRINVKPLTLLTLLAIWPVLAQGQEIREIRKTLPLIADGQLSLDTFKGSVTITTWDNPQVEIYARIEPDGQSADERKMVQNTEVRIDAGSGSIRIKSDYDKINQRDWDEDSGSLPLIHYTIKLPRTARLKIEDHKSKINISDLHSDLKIETHKGSVTVSRMDGAVELETHKGDARVEFANLARGSQFETHKGEIEIVVPRQKGFDLDSEVGKGANLDSDYDLGALKVSREDRETRYRGAINGGGPLLRVNSYKGNLRIRQQ